MEKSRGTKAFFSASAGIINQITRSILSLIVRKIFFAYIGAEILGLNTLFASIVSILSLTELGIGTAIGISLYRPLAENDYKKVGAYIKLLKKFYNILIIVIFAGGIFLMPVVVLSVNGDYNMLMVLCSYILYLLGTASSYLWAYYTTLLCNDQRGYTVSWVNCACTIVINIIQIMIIIFLKNYYLYLVTLILYNIVCNWIIKQCALWRYPWIESEIQTGELDNKEKEIVKKTVKDMFTYRIAIYLIQSLDNIIVSIMLGTAIVAYYGNYCLVANMLMAVVANIGNATTPGMGNLLYTDKKQIFSILNKITFIQQLVFSTTAIAMYVLTNDFVAYFFGEECVQSPVLVLFICILYYIQGMIIPLENMRTITGNYKDKYWQLGVSAFNIIISVALTKVVGISGVVIGTIVCYLIKGCILTPKIVFKTVLGEDDKKIYFKNVTILVVSFIVALFFCQFIPQLSKIPFIMRFIAKGFLTMGSVLLVNIAILYKTNIYKESKKYLMERISNKIRIIRK